MEHVLFVDKDPRSRSRALAALDRGGVPALALSSVDEALACLERDEPPCAVFLDLVTLGDRAEQVVRRVRAFTSSRPVHVFGLSESIARPPPACLDAVVPKPRSREAFRTLLQACGARAE